MKKILLLVLLLSPLNSIANECHVPGYKVSLFFGNGVLTDKDVAERTHTRLKEYFGLTYIDKNDPAHPVSIDYQDAYNQNEFIVNQFLEVVFQKETENVSNFFAWLSQIEPMPDWFKQAMEDVQLKISDFDYVIDSDLQQHVVAYRKAILEGNKVLVVAHSQGNFYANRAYEQLYQGGVLPNRPERPIAIVSVANPANAVGAPNSGLPYTTVDNDIIINSTRLFFPFVLPANINNTNETSDILHHYFVRTYLAGNESRTKILNDIQSTLDHTERYCSNFAGSYTLRDYACNISDPNKELEAFYLNAAIDAVQAGESLAETNQGDIVIYGSGNPDAHKGHIYQETIDFAFTIPTITSTACKEYLIGNQELQTDAINTAGIDVEIGDLFWTCAGANAKYYVNPDGVCYASFSKQVSTDF